MHTARYAYEQRRPLFCAALPLGNESVGDQDAGTRALLEEPAQRLPELLRRGSESPRSGSGQDPSLVRLSQRRFTSWLCLPSHYSHRGSSNSDGVSLVDCADSACARARRWSVSV